MTFPGIPVWYGTWQLGTGGSSIPREIFVADSIAQALMRRPCVARFARTGMGERCMPCLMGEVCEEHGSTHCECDGSAVAA